MKHRVPALAALILSSALLMAGCSRPSAAGLWDASVVVNNVTIPFVFNVTEEGWAVHANFFDGEVRVPSSEGRFDDGKTLVVKFGQYGTTLMATLDGDRMEGFYDRGTRGRGYAFNAVRHVDAPASSAEAPSIAGEWRI